MGRVLVVGGGVAGMQSSLDLAQMGHRVYLVEKERELGGNLKNLYKIFPKNEKTEEFLSNFTEKIKKHKEISVLMDSAICKVEEKTNSFEITVDIAGEEIYTFNVDVIVLATGFVPYDPTEKTEYGYSKYSDVVTSLDLERMIKDRKLVRHSDSKRPKSVTFVQCVGFRDSKAYNYCSSFCCTITMKNAILIKREYPEIEVRVMFMDIRTPSFYENLYSEARNIGVRFIRTRPAEIYEKNNKLVINFEDTLTSETRSIESELVVLSVGGTPPAETAQLAQMMKISLDGIGFFNVHNRPSATDVNRIFVIGSACGPKDIDYSLSEASAASSQINKLLRESHVTCK